MSKIQWLDSMAEEVSIQVTTQELDNDKTAAAVKLNEDEAGSEGGTDAPTAVDVQVSIEETASLDALISTKDLPENPKDGEGYQVGKDFWVWSNGRWVTRVGTYGHEAFDPSAINDAARHKTIEGFGHDPISGAHKRYVITGFDASTNPAAEQGDQTDQLVILIQNGMVPEVGVNGVTPEDLGKVLVALFEGYQSGQFACEHNARALGHLNGFLGAIRARTAERMERQVEGTFEK